MEQDNFAYQFKSLDDLQKIIEQLTKFAARPV